MKKNRAPIEVFTLSFLDIIACAFGAVVMLILLAKGGDEKFANTEQMIEMLKRGQEQAGLENAELKAQLGTQRSQASESSASLAKAQADLDKAQSDVKSAQKVLALLQDSQAKAPSAVAQPEPESATVQGKSSVRDEEVGGIPVDSDYVIFIIDTSGSMKQIWGDVMATMSDVLDNHPRVKGFQVLSDAGSYMISSSKKRWLEDTPQSRARVLVQMRSWSGNSQSSPVDGIKEALSSYGRRTDSLALYVFGDDFTGGSFDKALGSINRLNTAGGKKLARIHSVAFDSGSGEMTRLKFSKLMREVSNQNHGTFLTMN